MCTEYMFGLLQAPVSISIYGLAGFGNWCAGLHCAYSAPFLYSVPDRSGPLARLRLKSCIAPLSVIDVSASLQESSEVMCFHAECLSLCWRDARYCIIREAVMMRLWCCCIVARQQLSECSLESRRNTMGYIGIENCNCLL